MEKRCAWVNSDQLYLAYHDQEWGVPLYDNRGLFEMLILEGFQAGLSWFTILKKRDNFRAAFADFQPEKIARFDQKIINGLMQNKEIVRNRLKIEATISNARSYLKIQEDETFSNFIWQFVGGLPKINSWPSIRDLPVTSEESDRMSKELKKRGFRFVGSTICYAFMQAVGMVNDHTTDCFRYNQLV